jgi:signal recognition particle subunit SRP54
MGPIGNILGMLPGANAGQMKEALSQVDDSQLDRLQAIIRGMTPAERADPKIINGSRRLRIANGSGVTVAEVNDLVNRFFEARKMMKQMAGQFGFGSRSATKRTAKSRRGKKGKRGPTQPKPRAGLPAGMGMPDLSALPPSLRDLPPGLGGLDQLPPGFDPSKLNFKKGK